MADPAPRFNPQNALAVIAAIVLVGSEVLAVAVAAGWALAGLFRLGDVLFWVLEAAMIALAGLGIVAFTRLALKAEPIFGRSNR